MNKTNNKKAILLINLGTPESPEAKDVGPYLTEFLTDPDVIDIPYLLRQFLVRVLIVPKRKYASAKKYKTVWTEKGSPLLFHTEDITKKLHQELINNYDVRFAMRYGKPSIKEVMSNIHSQNYDELIVMPLYPHDTKSSVTTTVKKVNQVASNIGLKSKLSFIDPFYKEDFYIKPLAKSISSHPKYDHFEHILFSYHGIPAHHLPSSCLDNKQKLACKDVNNTCYRYQCFETTKLVANELGIDLEKVSTSFQSRLGNRPWVTPYSDHVIKDLNKKYKNIAVVTPSFIADCLETIEEVGMELKEEFEEESSEHGLTRIPCLNDQDYFISSLANYFLE